MGARTHKNKKKSFFLCARARVPYLEYFYKSTLKKILGYNFFLILKCAHARAHKNQKKFIFFMRACACTILRIFFKKKSTFILIFQKSTLKKILPYTFFDIQMRTRARIKIKKNHFFMR